MPTRGLSQRCFSWIHGHNLVYNACWEDPRLDRVALELGPDDSIVMITSAGCNALDYALDAPKRIVAVDVNPRQNALLELKQAGIRRLSFDDFFGMFGCGHLSTAVDAYRDVLRQDLSPWARHYWDRRIVSFSGGAGRGSFYFSGTSGLFARAVNFYIDHVAKVRDDVNDLLDATSLDAQQEIFDARLRPAIRSGLVRWMLQKDMSLALVGVPRPQREYLERQSNGGVFEFVHGCLESVFSRLPIADNYFWRVYLTGSYSRSCCPEYLRRENFERLKGGLVDRVTTRTGTLAAVLEQETEPISRFILLDHMDWLVDADPGELRREWQAMLDRAAPGARALWRSAGARTDFVDAIETTFRGRRRRVGDLLSYARELAVALHAADRVHTYASFHIATFEAAS